MTKDIAQDFQVATTLQNKSFTEFNDKSLLTRADIDQKRWNAYRAPQSDDPDEAWRWNGIRPVTRNKIIAIVAQMTSKTVIPAPTAQNDQDEQDEAAAEIMRDLMEYDIRNSNYVDNYISFINAALVDPMAYLGVGFHEAMQTIREVNQGKVSKKDVIDGVMSGFQTYNIPLDEILIGNYYQKSLDKQRFIIRRRYIEYDEAELLYGEHENFKYVSPGIKFCFSQENSMFYDVFDDTLSTLAEEVYYYNRLEDMEVCYVNGIYLGTKNPEANAFKHRDADNRPRYNLSNLGYEHISPRFFFCKSTAWKLGDDDELVNRMEQLTVDATFLSVMPPQILSGAGMISEAIIIPGKTTTIESPDARIQPISLGSAVSAGWQAINSTRESMSESTFDSQIAGQQSGNQKTAREAVILDANAKVALGLFGNMLANSLKRLGNLMIDVILQHQTVAEVEELTNGKTVEKWKTFVLDTQVGGKQVTKKIQFKPDMMGESMTLDSYMQKSGNLLNQEGVDGKVRLYEVNPEAWRKLKYQIVIDVQELLPKNEVFEKALKQEAFDRLMSNPLAAQFIDVEAVVKDFLIEPYAGGDADKYMKKQPNPQMMPPEQAGGGGGGGAGGLIPQLTNSQFMG